MSTTPPRHACASCSAAANSIVAPGVFDGISAQLARRTGHVAAYMTGAGRRRIGLRAARHRAGHRRPRWPSGPAMIADALGDVPLIADADTGYGAPINVVRTVRQYEAAGVAAIQLEDQAFPKRCGHLPDKQVVDTGRLRADAGRRPGRAIGRRHARGRPHRRARRRSGSTRRSSGPTATPPAGADVIFVEAPQGVDEIERIARGGRRPAADQPGARRPDPASSRRSGCRSSGYAIAIHPSDPLARADASRCSRALCALNGSDVADFLPDQARRLLQPGRHGRVVRELDAKLAATRRTMPMGMTIIEKIFARKAGSGLGVAPVTPSSSTST